MVNLIAAKREWIVKFAKLSDDEKRSLRGICPADKHTRLFGGKLQDFLKAKQEGQVTAGLNAMVNTIKGMKRPANTQQNQPSSSYSKKGKTKNYWYSSQKGKGNPKSNPPKQNVRSDHKRPDEFKPSQAPKHDKF